LRTGSGGQPFVSSDAGDGSAPDGGAAVIDGAATLVEAGQSLGGPCLDDTQCDDGVDCTRDACNLALRRCEFSADDTRCDNGVYCDGDERCDLELGCRPGAVRDCSDSRTCTIDTCLEATRSCQHVLRDADGDSVPDGHCMEGGDCDDSDPSVFPGHPEVCGNGKDDNCDGRVDETECVTPMHDTCLDPLLIGASGVYQLDTTAANFDYPGSCAPSQPGRRDVVVALQLAGRAMSTSSLRFRWGSSRSAWRARAATPRARSPATRPPMRPRQAPRRACASTGSRPARTRSTCGPIATPTSCFTSPPARPPPPHQ